MGIDAGKPLVLTAGDDNPVETVTLQSILRQSCKRATEKNDGTRTLLPPDQYSVKIVLVLVLKKLDDF